jgi:hypothetical protein
MPWLVVPGSPPTRASLEADTTFWRHAYLIAKETGLRRVGRRRVAEEGV